MLTGCVNISGLKVLIRKPVAIVVHIVTGFRTGLSRLTEPPQGPITNGATVAFTKPIRIRAWLGGGQPIIYETVAVIILAIAQLVGGRRRITRAPTRISITGLEPIAEADFIFDQTRALCPIISGVTCAGPRIG
jgi:hypothetical protein